MMLTTDRPNQARLLFAALSVGVVVDTLLLMLGVYGFPGGSIVDWLPPVWMTVLWIQFATTFRYCLSWLSGRYALCSIAALFGAPLAFVGGERLGARHSLLSTHHESSDSWYAVGDRCTDARFYFRSYPCECR